MRTRVLATRATIATIILVGAFVSVPVSAARAAGTLVVSTCGASVFGHAAVFGLNTLEYCPPGTNAPPGMSIMTGGNKVAAGTHATWQADAPAGLAITGASIAVNQMYSIHINDGTGWGGGFYWQGGNSTTHNGETSYTVSGLDAGYFGFKVVCGWSICNGSTNPAQLTVESMNLVATETRGPALTAPDGLWQASGWVRGTWPLHFYGDSPSGLCSLTASVNGQPIPGTTSAQNGSVWHQCSAPAVNQTIQTGNYGQGAIPLTIGATDAAGVPASTTKTLYVDNSSPTIAISGPQDAPTTAGVQYLSATATAGPSGVAGISCSLDGGSSQWHPGATASIPVQGLGNHTLTCSSADNARDAAGNAGWSAPTTWSLSIREPTVTNVSFDRIAGSLHCRRTRERIHVPAQLVWVHVGHRRVHARVPAQTRIVSRVRCHPSYIRRRVRIGGHLRIVRIPELPHSVRSSIRRVRFGRASMLHGWLGTSQGNAVGGQMVQILAAPDNGSSAFVQEAVATTAADGTWSVKLPAGPSRIVKAVYGGGASLEPSSGQATVLVPASIQLHVRRHAHWGGRLVLTGRVRGGYLPAAGETVILSVRFRGKEHDFAHLAVSGDGRFRYVYTFLPGSGQASYPFSAETVRESGYAYTPGRSRPKTVIVTP
ncbi:MAG: hypothetical protein ACYDHH_28580 [Solirubrobacteraceae bacterium]